MKDAPRDALTGALSRHTLDATLCEALEQSRAEQSSVALLLVDVDYLKLLNDAFGHRAGDGALVAIADALRQHLTDKDRLFRYGGDEFVVLLPQTSAEAAHARASAMLATVQAKPYVPAALIETNPASSQAEAGSSSTFSARAVSTEAVKATTGETTTETITTAVRRPQVTLSLSIGVAHMTVAADVRDLELLAQHLFEEADQHAYAAKRAGRGRVSDGQDLTNRDNETADVRLLGREEALEQVRRFLSAPVTATMTPALTVRGQVGMGVSRLLHHAQSLAQLMGDVVVTLHGSRALRERKLGALSEAHVSVSWLDWYDLTEPTKVRRKLTKHAPTGQLLVVVDRVDLLDEASRHYLHALLAITLPIKLIYSVLDDQSRRADDGASDLHKVVEIADTISLSALSFEDVLHWLQGRLGERLAAPAALPASALPARSERIQHAFVRAIYDLTRGIPARVSIVLTALETGLVTRTDSLDKQLATLTSLLDTRARRSNVPMSRGMFVGRYQEVATLKRWLRPGALVSVVGADGMGKSRLALQVARESASHFLGGVYWLSLTALTTYNQLVYALAETMHVPFSNSQDPDAPVFGLLRQAPTLLVLDDVTVLPPVLELIGNIHQRAPSTALCITSQVSLKLASERVLQLPPLPDPQVGNPALNSSVGLFVEYARQAAPTRHFDVHDEHFLQALRHICERVSATPLGLELAAAWCGVYDVPAIATRLQADALQLEDAPPAGSPADPNINPPMNSAGASVRVMLDAFWTLLSAHEQQVLASLAVFPSYFAEDNAKVIAGASPFFLTSLWHKSFLNHRATGNRSDDGRYSMPLLLRQFVAAKLAAKPHWQQHAQHAFVRYYVQCLQDLEPTLWDNRQRHTFALLHHDIDNISQAWRWLPAFDAAVPGGAVALDPQGKATMLLRNYFEMKGHARRGAELFDVLATYFAPLQPRFASFHAYAAARLWSRAGDIACSHRALQQAKGLLQRCIEPPEGFTELPWLSILEATNALFIGDVRHVPVILDVGLAEAARFGAERGASSIERSWLSGYITLALWYQQQDGLARAQQILQRAELMSRRAGARVELCRALHFQGALYIEQAAWRQAKRAFKVGLERASLITFNRSQALCCMGLARCLSQSNAIALVNRPLAPHVMRDMRDHLEQALHYVEHSGSIVELLHVLRERASLAHSTGDVVEATDNFVRALTIAKNSPFVPSALQLLAVLAWHYEDMRAEVLPVIYHHPAASMLFRRKLREQFGQLIEIIPTEIIPTETTPNKTISQEGACHETQLSTADAERQLAALHDDVLMRLQQALVARAS